MLAREPLLTRGYVESDFALSPNSAYLYSSSPETRSALDPNWVAAQVEPRFVDVVGGRDTIQIAGRTYGMRGSDELIYFMEALGSVYLDITGMNHSTWTPLLVALLEAKAPFKVVYREPMSYKRASVPSPGAIYDLSEAIGGIAPIPGVATIATLASPSDVFVPMLGFEGARLSYVLRESQVDPARLVPVVGAPGFQVDYIVQAILGNREVIDEYSLAPKLRYATANCPFDLFHLLFEIQRSYGGKRMRLAPIGTKPHGLGAVLYALSRPSTAEIIYDHPRRTSGRTSGASRICVYDVAQFAESDLFLGQGDFT